MISDEAYRLVLGLGLTENKTLPRGGQELIMHEIIALLFTYDIKSLWLPFSIGPLAEWCYEFGINIVLDNFTVSIPSAEALYFGTPTIVNDKALFEENDLDGEWGVVFESAYVRRLCWAVDQFGYRLIISGLGSGDVTEQMRISDMRLYGWSEPRVVAWKDFGEFQDSVLVMVRL